MGFMLVSRSFTFNTLYSIQCTNQPSVLSSKLVIIISDQAEQGRDGLS